MQQIKSIRIVATDSQTASNAKQIISTRGEFYSRGIAYNQTFLRLEKTMQNYNCPPFRAMPLTVLTLRYLIKQNPQSKLKDIKSITKSRLAKTVEFTKQVERIKGISFTNQNIVLYYFQIPMDDYDTYDFEDLRTLALIQIEADIPHITLVLHPKKSFAENKEYYDDMVKKLKPHQDLIPLFTPRMRKFEGEQLLNKIIAERRSKITLITGYSPTATSLYFYSYLWQNHPKEKLLIAADVKDSFGDKEQKLPTHLALRRFGIDITCRRVTFPVGQKFDFPVPVEEICIYDDQTGGLLTDEDQRRWYGISVTDVIMQNFPANTGLDFREYALSYNFTRMNESSLKEVEAIIKNKHLRYIDDRPILKAYWMPNGDEL